MPPRKRSHKIQGLRKPKGPVTRSQKAAFKLQEARNRLDLASTAAAHEAQLADRRSKRQAVREVASKQEAAPHITEAAARLPTSACKGTKRKRSDTLEDSVEQPARSRQRLQSPATSEEGVCRTELKLVISRPRDPPTPSPPSSSSSSFPSPPPIQRTLELMEADEEIEEIATEAVRAERTAVETPSLGVDAIIRNYRMVLDFEGDVRARMGFNARALAGFEHTRRTEFAYVTKAIEREAAEGEQQRPARRISEIPRPVLQDPGTDLKHALRNARAMVAFIAALKRNNDPEQRTRNAAGMERLQKGLNRAFAVLAEVIDHGRLSETGDPQA